MKTISIIAIVASASTVLATPLVPRQDSCAELCGSSCYSSSAISGAAQAACSALQADGGNTGGRDKGSYPHEYEDREGFNFPDSGPFYEYPILGSGSVYSGRGSPGPDRVIINSDCSVEGLVTHSGASGDDFKLCTGGN